MYLQSIMKMIINPFGVKLHNMRYLIVLLLFCSCGYSINQQVKGCRDETHFQIYTVVYPVGITNNILYYSRTWLASVNNCLSIGEVDSAKKAEYKKAEIFIVNYKKATH